MTFGYLFRLTCLCLACFFLVHLVLALLVQFATAAAVRAAARMKPTAAARFLLLLRMFPAGFGILIVAGFCAPSYLWLEPRAATDERIGPICLALSALAAALWGISITRGFCAMVRSARYLRRCETAGCRSDLCWEGLPVWVLQEPLPLFAIGGIVRPRLVMSSAVQTILSEDQLAAAVRHERAHWISRDNLKRLLLLLTPDALPFLGGFNALQRGWGRYTERAADDHSSAGDPAQCLALASALVRVSRLGTASRSASLMAPLLAGDDDLAERVRRLLTMAPVTSQRSFPAMVCFSAIGVVATFLVVLAFQAPMLIAVHRFLEYLIQ